MDTSVLSSTFLLTLLLLVGLFFFIRASVKDRTQVASFVSDQSDLVTAQQLNQYFADRAYRVTQVNPTQNEVALEGNVRPSLFLAIFLSGLAAVGSLCLALVLSVLLPAYTNVLLGLVLLAPLAGVFYWQKAGRSEGVRLKIESIAPTETGQSRVTITAHRDELAALRRTLPLRSADE